MYDELLYLLTSLDGVRQDLRYHPEGDALFHALQVFNHALRAKADPPMLAAALLHDIGKAVQNEDHADIGANDLEGLLSPRVVWLVRHHMDLHYKARKTRALLLGTPELKALEQLRAWDIAGRNPRATVMSPEEAIERLMDHQHQLVDPSIHHSHTIKEHA